jgi:hypothetical protein
MKIREVEFIMENLICHTQPQHLELRLQADAIVKRTMTRLKECNIYLISAQTEVDNIAQLHWLAHDMLQQCHRVVVLASQFEDMNLIVAKSANVSHLYADEIMKSIFSVYRGQYNRRNNAFTQATFYQYNMMPEIIDYAVESVVVALPYA